MGLQAIKTTVLACSALLLLGPLDDLIGHSITDRIAVEPRAGQKLSTLQTVPPRLPGLEGDADGAVRAGGFSLHAGLDIAASERLALGAPGQVRYTLRTPPRMHLTRCHGVFAPHSRLRAAVSL